MNIQIIRVVEKEVLLSVKFEEYEKDELARIFDQWRDVAFLEDFFTANYEDLNGEFYGVNSIEDAVLDTLQHAENFKDRIKSLSKGERGENLNQLFKPYDNKSIETLRERSKARGAEPNSWLRLYAIRLDDNLFIVTGGAIKLTKNMTKEHLQIEHRKMDLVKHYLKVDKIDSRKDYGFIDLE